MTVRHEITSLQHPLVKHLVKLRQESAYRYAQRSLLVEGSKPIQEIAPFIQKLIYTSSHAPLLKTKACEEWIVTDAMMQKISGMTNPEGVVAEARMPSFSSLEEAHSILALDGINDPGNLGTLMRTALALGWDGIYLLPTSCDPYNEKVLRAARGAHFKLALRQGTAEELKQLAQQQTFQCLVADLQGQPPEAFSAHLKTILVLGNEAHGASAAVQEFCVPVTISMKGEMESLNVAVAGGILLYLLKKG